MTREEMQRTEQLEKLLREAIKIVHCHARNIDKDWLTRARAAVREKRRGSPDQPGHEHAD